MDTSAASGNYYTSPAVTSGGERGSPSAGLHVNFDKAGRVDDGRESQTEKRQDDTKTDNNVPAPVAPETGKGTIVDLFA